MATRVGSKLQAQLLITGVCVAIVAAFALVSVVTGDGEASDHVVAGVQSMNRDFSNLKRAEVPGAVKNAFAEYARLPFRLRYADVDLVITAANLGLSLDADATVERLLAAGRQDTFWDRLARLAGREPERTVLPVVAVDDRHLDEAIESLASAVDRPAQDAELHVDSDGIRLRPAANGRRLNRAASKDKLREHLIATAPGDVVAFAVDAPPIAREWDWLEAARVAAKIISGPVTINYGDRTWLLEPYDLAAMIEPLAPKISGQNGQIRWNERALAELIDETVGKELYVPPVDAKVVREDNGFTVVPGVDGSKVDGAATALAIMNAAMGDNRSAAVLMITAVPGVSTNDWRDAVALANRAASDHLKLTFQNQSWTFSQADIAAALTFTQTTATDSSFLVTVDTRQIKEVIGRIAKQLNRTPREPRVKLVDGKVTLASKGEDGRTLDVDAASAAIARQVFRDDRTVPLVVSVAKPKLAPDDVAKLTFPDVVTDAATSYAGSIPERAHNVELAASRLAGTLVPPGSIFSFNRSVGPTTLAAGYQIGYGITIKDGEAVTVPAEAGGICQVATTMFQAAFWAGYPIVERQNHIYWISRYESRGMKGLDATVDDPYLDFQFKNNTPDWLMVEASADGSTIRFTLRGKKPDWQVKVDAPVFANVVAAAQATVRQDDPTMPKGSELWVEHAEDGFASRIRRTVTRGGEVVDTYTAASSYRPARNVLLIGTKDLPTPTPTATLAATTTVVPPSATPTTTTP